MTQEQKQMLLALAAQLGAMSEVIAALQRERYEVAAYEWRRAADDKRWYRCDKIFYDNARCGLIKGVQVRELYVKQAVVDDTGA